MSPGKPTQVEEMAMLIRMLVRKVERHQPGSTLAAKATSYLRRHNLQGNPLRSDVDTEFEA